MDCDRIDDVPNACNLTAAASGELPLIKSSYDAAQEDRPAVGLDQQPS